jgi:hypothetical protein
MRIEPPKRQQGLHRSWKVLNGSKHTLASHVGMPQHNRKQHEFGKPNFLGFENCYFKDPGISKMLSKRP